MLIETESGRWVEIWLNDKTRELLTEKELRDAAERSVVVSQSVDTCLS